MKFEVQTNYSQMAFVFQKTSAEHCWFIVGVKIILIIMAMIIKLKLLLLLLLFTWGLKIHPNNVPTLSTNRLNAKLQKKNSRLRATASHMN